MPGLCSRIEPETFCSSLLILSENTRTRELKAMLYWAYESWSEREGGGKKKSRRKGDKNEGREIGGWRYHYWAFLGMKGNDPVKRRRESGSRKAGGRELPLCSAGWVSLTQLNGALENRANQKPSSLNKTSQVAANVCHLRLEQLAILLKSYCDLQLRWEFN